MLDLRRRAWPVLLRRLLVTLACLAGLFFNFALSAHKDFPESRWDNLWWLTADGGCWAVAWLAWLDGVRCAWRREAPTGPARRRFVEVRVPAALLLLGGTVGGVVPGVERVMLSDY